MRTNRRSAWLWIVLLPLVAPPAAQAGGVIEVTFEGPEGADRGWAVELQMGKHVEGRRAGERVFRFADLPFGTWCLVFRRGDHIVEGLRYGDEVYTGAELAGEDRQSLEAEVLAQETFFDRKTLWALRGGSRRAVAFVFNERFKPWYDNPTGSLHTDTLIRRFDVQVMRKSGVAWIQDKLFFLWREEVPRANAPSLTHQYEESLACIALTAEQPVARVGVKF